MCAFVLVAGVIGAIHLVVGWERPRLAIAVSGIVWLLYAVYEYFVAAGVLCDADCNIRADLVFIIPLLGFATFCAHQSYMGLPIPKTLVGVVIGTIASVVFVLVSENFRYGALASVVIVAGLAIGAYVIKSKWSNRGP